MKAKRLVTLALPIMLLSACTTETYGLTQAEFRKVDKEFKADKMIEDMKRMHYKDEEIERQLRGALAKLEYEEEQRSGKKSDKKSESQTEVDKEKENSSAKETRSGNDKTNKKHTIPISSTEFPDYMFDLLIDLKYSIRTLKKESDAFSIASYEGEPKDTIIKIYSQLDSLERVEVPKKYTDYEYIIKEGIEDIRDYLPKVEKAFKKYEDPRNDKKKVKDEVEDALDGIDSGMYTWQPFFADMNDKDPNALKEAIKNKQDVIKQDHNSFGKGTSSTTDGSINYTPKK
ncbi:hypothetical protein ABH955_005039 [Bacillus sp. RC240]|uniref:hypothetical protein n=1 Tax=unclassified Bacillus (in: firmicutes) TaxID=185979 RepID=UPI0038328A3F